MKRRVHLILGGVSGVVALMACATTLNNTAGGGADTGAPKITAPVGAASGTTAAQQSPYTTGR